MDGPDELDLTERLVTPAEMAQIMEVDEADVLAWIEGGELGVQRGEDGAPRVRIREHYEVDGPSELGFVFCEGPRDPQLAVDARAARQARERDARLTMAGAVGVNIEALTAALAQRLSAVAPAQVQISTYGRDMVNILDVRGGGSSIDIADAVSMGEASSSADRVVNAARRLLEEAQDEIAEVTTDPWPRQGIGTLPEPHARLSQDGVTVRMFYGDPADPVLELAGLPVADFLSP